MALTLYEITDQTAWTDVTPSVIRFLWQKGLEKAQEQDKTQKIFGFWLGETHPAYVAASDQLLRESKPYAYYMRVPDLAAFLNKVPSCAGKTPGPLPLCQLQRRIEVELL